MRRGCTGRGYALPPRQQWLNCPMPLPNPTSERNCPIRNVLFAINFNNNNSMNNWSSCTSLSIFGKNRKEHPSFCRSSHPVLAVLLLPPSFQTPYSLSSFLRFELASPQLYSQQMSSGRTDIGPSPRNSSYNCEQLLSRVGYINSQH